MFNDYFGLGDYMGYFEAAPQTQPSQSGLIKFPVLTAQGTLNRLGARLVEDGLFGPNTKRAWESAAMARKLNPVFQRVDGKTVLVHPATAGTLSAAASNTPKPVAAKKFAASKPAAVKKPAMKKPTVLPAAPAGDLVTRSVLDLQDVLYKIGWTTKKVKRDGLFGSQTKNAWAHSAKTRGLPQTFDRVDGKNARVSLETLNRFLIDGKTGPAPAAAMKPAAPSGANVYPVLDLQTLLYGIGWTAKKLKRDGKFGPQTAGAWAISAKTRKLPTTFVRVDGAHARVDPATYAKIVADAKSGSPVPVALPAGASSAAPAAASAAGTITQPVLQLQDVLYGIGWTTKKVKRDGLFGSQTKNAWATSAKTRNLPQTFERVDGKTARVALATLNKFLADAKKAPAPEAGKTTVTIGDALVNISVDAAQKLLYSIGWTAKKLKNDGAYGAQTKNAWATSAKSRKLPVTFERIDGKNARVDSRTLSAFLSDAKRAAAEKAPPAPPEPSQPSVATSAPAGSTQDTKALFAKAVKAVVAAASSPIAVLTVQQALHEAAKVRGAELAAGVALDGKWNKTIGDRLMQLYKIQSASAAVWAAAWPKLVSKDGKTLKFLPNWVSELEAIAKIYKDKANAIATQTVAPVSAPEAMQPVLAPAPQELGPLPGQSASVAQQQTWSQSGGGGGAPTYVMDAPAMEPPSAEQSTALAPVPPPDDTTWNRLVATLQSLGDKAPKLTEAVEQATQRGELAPETVQAYAEWVASAKNILASTQALLSMPQLKQAIDAVGGGGAAPSELSMYFGDLAGSLSAPSDDLIATVAEPFPVVTVNGTPLAGFGQAAQVAQVAGATAAVAARFLSGAWAKLIQLIASPTVARVGTATVAANAATNVLNSEMDRYAEREERLDKYVAEGLLTVEERDKLKGQAPGSGADSVVIPVAVGAVVLGGFWLWLKNKKSGGSHARSR